MTTTRQEPILASWKISKVLQEYPQLLDVLINLTPAFRKLRNPMLRKVQTRLVTVEQAAGIAGLDPRQLVRTLNQEVGNTPPDEDLPSKSTAGPAAAPPWFGTTTVARELDVRPMLEQGQEPFKVITAAAREVPEGEVLRLVVGFEPLPLYDALAKQGFVHWGEQDAEGAWHVEFMRQSAAASAATKPKAHAAAPVGWDAPASHEVTIDVSELVPPEPLIKIMRTLEEMPAGGRLLVHHVRRPIHLYDQLDEQGYAHDTRELAPGQVQVLIQKPSGEGRAS